MLPNDPLVYLLPLCLVTLVAAFIQIRQYESELKKRRRKLTGTGSQAALK